METRARIRFVVGLVLVALGAFLLTSLLTHDPHEGPFPDFTTEQFRANACGIAGAHASAYALAMVGWTAYPLAGLVALMGVLLAVRVKVGGLVIRGVGLALIVAATVLGLAVLNAAPGSSAGSYRAAPGVGAGVCGILLAGTLYRAVGSTGTLILFLFSSCVGVFLLGGAELGALYGKLAGLGKRFLFKGMPAGRERAPSADVLLAGPQPEPAVRELAPAGVEPEDRAAAEAARVEEEVAPAEPEPTEPEVVTRYTRIAKDASDDEELAELFEGLDREDGAEYRLPPPGLLDEFASPPGEEDESEIREKGRVLERTLAEFKVEARVVRVRRGPVITMYELSLSPGTKVSKVESLADDLAIALKAPNVRIVAPLPGKNTVGIEVPNTQRELVGVRELMEEVGKKAAKMAIPLFLGKDTAGSPLLLDLAACPHLLVAGATGSGKSVAINAMIGSILMTRTPDELQLLLVDPKSVEFSQYARLPHLMCPVLSDMKKAASVLKWACKKMDERYSILSRVGLRDLKSYNALGEEEIVRRLNPEGDAVIDDVPFRMSHIVIIVDEFGELMMVAAKEVESSIIRLSQKARAVGIHLICATQRPSVDVITGLIKSNLPARIAFQVSSKVDSRTILDRNGAELLLGRGDMLLLPPGTSRLVRAQGAFISEEEISRVVDFLESQGGPQFKAELREYHAQQEVGQPSDELYDEAVRVVVETQRGSVSLLQRRLSVGYSRAARLIDMMAEAGIVGPWSGSQARRVLMTLEQWDSAHAKA